MPQTASAGPDGARWPRAPRQKLPRTTRMTHLKVTLGNFLWVAVKRSGDSVERHTMSARQAPRLDGRNIEQLPPITGCRFDRLTATQRRLPGTTLTRENRSRQPPAGSAWAGPRTPANVELSGSHRTSKCAIQS